MTRRILLSLGAGFLVACAVWLSVLLCAPDLYVERAFAIIFYSSLAATVVTFITLRFSEYLLLKAAGRNG
jgi:hypothetical protein